MVPGGSAEGEEPEPLAQQILVNRKARRNLSQRARRNHASIAGFYSHPNGIGAGTNPECGKHGRSMHLHGPLANAQFVGDLLVQLAASNVNQDFSLPTT